MLRTMLRLLMLLSLPALWAASSHAEAYTLNARIQRVATAVVTLEQVKVRLSWPAQAEHGELELQAGHIQAPDLGYRFRDVSGAALCGATAAAAGAATANCAAPAASPCGWRWTWAWPAP
ncbi:hypothetical protein, partial [Lysobacter capsici]|uniref:hypothetical protein n=1 Tax=Lysobacter capsici TaxID=435897 RepID=UPI00398C8A4C